jgi:hypothetical protein
VANQEVASEDDGPDRRRRPHVKGQITQFDPKYMSVRDFMRQIEMVGTACGWSDKVMAMQAVSNVSKFAFGVIGSIPAGEVSFEEVKQAFKDTYEPDSQVQTYKAQFQALRRDPHKEAAHDFAMRLKTQAIKAYPNDTRAIREDRVIERFWEAQPDDVRVALATLISGVHRPDIGQLVSATSYHEAATKAVRSRKAGRPISEVACAGSDSETEDDREVNSLASDGKPGRRRPPYRERGDSGTSKALEVIMKKLGELTTASSGRTGTMANSRMNNQGPRVSSINLKDMVERLEALQVAQVQLAGAHQACVEPSTEYDLVEMVASQVMGRPPRPNREGIRCFVCDNEGHMWRDCPMREYIKEMVQKAKMNPGLLNSKAEGRN